MTLEIQALTMIHMVGAGVYLGTSFDTFSRLRVKKKNQWVIIIQDVLFWLLNGLFIFIWLQSVNEGEMRMYIFLSLLCGFALYKALLQDLFQKILERLIQIVILLYRFILQLVNILIITPLRWLYQLIIVFFLFSTGVLIESVRYMYKLLLFLARPVGFFFVTRWEKIWDKEDKKDNNDKNKALVGTQKKGIWGWVAKGLFRKKT